MKKRIAVTGLGCISPLGNDVAATWEQASKGVSGIDKITKFDASEYRSQMAGEVQGFDPGEIVPPPERKKMDLFIQYAVVAAHQALQDSGLEITDELSHHAGVSIGVGLGGLSSIEKYHEVVLEKGPKRISPFFIPMVISNMASGQVSLKYNLRGYNTSTASACSSSNHSIGDAARIIERGDAKVMLVGGAESVVTPLGIGGFAAMHALSTRNDDPTRASRPYDKDRDGFVMGEGGAVLVLEDYEFAKSRGARIYCELAGYGFSSDAHHMTAPNEEGPSRAMSLTLSDGGINPEDVGYINTHGTSTPAGDINELNAIKRTLGADLAKKVSISSSKSMTGHLLGAAGAIEAVVAIMAMQNNFVPPTINIENLDPECDLDVTPNQGKEREIKVALSNSFGFGGTNASLVFKAV